MYRLKKVLLTAGPIPARLDSVKYITNRFKGGLMRRLADYLVTMGCDVTVAKWEHLDRWDNHKELLVKDVNDYYGKVLAFNADAYILGAAVANLSPVSPWVGKFPSHNYSEGEKFNIEFEISPRVIDALRDIRPKATLIGYKLLDGSDDELILASRKLLISSKAHVIFANRPSTAKTKKLMMTQDFSVIPKSFADHMHFIYKTIYNKWYGTEISKAPCLAPYRVNCMADEYYCTMVGERTFGSFAVKDDESGFWTTTRGKNGGRSEISRVYEVNHSKRVVLANKKATMNAPLIDKIFELNPYTEVVLHDHIKLPNVPTFNYEMPGTAGEVNIAYRALAEEAEIFNIEGHGYIAGFKSVREAIEWQEIQTI